VKPSEQNAPKNWLIYRFTDSLPRRGLLDGIYAGVVLDQDSIDEAARAAILILERSDVRRVAVSSSEERGVFLAFGTPAWKRGKFADVRFSLLLHNGELPASDVQTSVKKVAKKPRKS
jgi:hypothetical protein